MKRKIKLVLDVVQVITAVFGIILGVMYGVWGSNLITEDRRLLFEYGLACGALTVLGAWMLSPYLQRLIDPGQGD